MASKTDYNKLNPKPVRRTRGRGATDKGADERIGKLGKALMGDKPTQAQKDAARAAMFKAEGPTGDFRYKKRERRPVTDISMAMPGMDRDADTYAGSALGNYRNYKKGGPIKEPGTGEVYKSKAAMMRHEAKETPAMERKEHGYMKGGAVSGNRGKNMVAKAGPKAPMVVKAGSAKIGKK